MSLKTQYQKVRDWFRNYDERMQQPVALPEVNHDHHICTHCGYGFDGRCCPQCGMPAGHVRFTFRLLINNFLDIWGLGSRPMFRTILDLFRRPGYMIRDYLSGHHLSYFPPFKMLAVFTIFIVFIAWIFNFKDPLVATRISDALNKIDNVSNNTRIFIDFIGKFLVFIDKNDIYRILIQNVLVVLAAWIVFRNKGYNLVETFFSQIYINCQFHLITLLWMLFAWNLPPTVFLPYYVPASISFFVLIFDYKQLYGLTYKMSIWKTILFLIMVMIIYVIFFLLLLVIIESYDMIINL